MRSFSLVYAPIYQVHSSSRQRYISSIITVNDTAVGSDTAACYKHETLTILQVACLSAVRNKHRGFIPDSQVPDGAASRPARVAPVTYSGRILGTAVESTVSSVPLNTQHVQTRLYFVYSSGRLHYVRKRDHPCVYVTPCLGGCTAVCP